MTTTRRTAGAAYDVIQEGGLPIGVVYRNDNRPSLDQHVERIQEKVPAKSAQDLIDSFQF